MPPKRRRPERRRVGGLWLALALGGALAAALVVASVALRGGNGQSSGNEARTDTSVLDAIPQRGTVLGDPAAPATLIEYADLSCPFCARYANDVLPSIVDRYVRSGRLKLEFRGLAFLRPVDNSARALRYALAAGAQNKFWDYVEQVYANQGQEGTEWFTDDFGRSVAEQIPGVDVNRLTSDAAGAAVTGEIARSAAQAEQAHVAGTPTFFLRKDAEAPYPIVVSELSPQAFTAAIDDVLAG